MNLPKKFCTTSLGVAALQALEDLKAVEKMKETYAIDMGCWHGPGDEKCYVCFAGSVMANRLGVKPNEEAAPEDFDSFNMLEALDHFRMGDIYTAMSAADTDVLHNDYEDLETWDVDCPYDENPTEFKSQVKNLALAVLKAEARAGNPAAKKALK